MIIIKDYNLEWPRWYDTEKKLIMKQVGQWIKAIEHVGSTSVPNLAAKPTIDICIGVNSFDYASNIILSLKQIDYHYIQEYEAFIPERRYLQKLDEIGNHLFHIHIVIFGDKLWNEYLRFRNYLIAHPEDAKAYSELKRSLQSRFPHDRKAYTEGKSDFILHLQQKASVWAAKF
jgi:GrpB-like predicted nucleotidyltransferase (UPF0157 family)